MDNDEYRRESFYQAENGMHLDAYGKNQKIYDSFSNEWDCCDEFGESSQYEFLDDDGIDDDYPMMPSPGAPLAEGIDDGYLMMTPPDTPLAEYRSFTIARSAEVTFNWEDFETPRLLYEIYGFVSPLPLTAHAHSPPINDKDLRLLSTIVGLRRNDAVFFKSPLAPLALEFLQFLSTSRTPKNSTWDIADGNRVLISGSKLFRRMRVIEGTGDPGQEERERWYVFDFKKEATVPWMVAVPNVIDAFFVCRLDYGGGSNITDFEIARELLNHGIRFSTLLTVKSLPRSISPAITVPVRLANYKFTQDDYFAYEQEHAALLSDTRVARSALLHGGIVWRLAVATLSFDDVLEGPTTAATLQRRGIVVKTSDSSVDLCDDGLSQLELDIICGLHRCQTGMFSFTFLIRLLTIIRRSGQFLHFKIVVAN
jgi:hypothetical protein